MNKFSASRRDYHYAAALVMLRQGRDTFRGVTKRVPSGEFFVFLRKNKTQQSTQNAESHPSRRFLFFPVFSRVSNRSSPPRRLSVRRTRFRGPSATPQFSTDTPKIAAPTLGVSAEHPSQSSQPVLARERFRQRQRRGCPVPTESRIAILYIITDLQ